MRCCSLFCVVGSFASAPHVRRVSAGAARSPRGASGGKTSSSAHETPGTARGGSGLPPLGEAGARQRDSRPPPGRRRGRPGTARGRSASTRPDGRVHEGACPGCTVGRWALHDLRTRRLDDDGLVSPQGRLHPRQHRRIGDDEPPSPGRGVEHRLGCPDGDDAVQRTEIHRFDGLRGDGDEQVLGLPAAVRGQHGGGVAVVAVGDEEPVRARRLRQGSHDLGIAEPPDVTPPRRSPPRAGPTVPAASTARATGRCPRRGRVRSRRECPPGAATGRHGLLEHTFVRVHPRIVRGHRQGPEEEVPDAEVGSGGHPGCRTT